MVEKKIEALVLEKLKEEEYKDCFLIEIVLNNNKLNVFIDSDEAVTFQKCQRISRYLEQFIDEEGWLGEKYTLEVSSCGTDRPLKLMRQYHKNVGRTVEVDLTSGETKKGLLKKVNNDHIILEEKVRIKEGKKKKTSIVESEIPMDNINKTVVKITFKS